MPSPALTPTPLRAPPRRALLRRRRRRPQVSGPFPVKGTVLRASDDVGARAAAGAVALLTLVALALRLAVPRGLWLDEAISVRQAHLGLGALIQNLAETDRHPPLHHLALWATVHLIGDGELAVRLPSIIAGTLLVGVLYGIGAEVYDRRTGIVAALFGTFAPLLVWYSQEARMYAFVAFFGALTVLGCVRALRRGGAGSWALYVAGATGLLWSHWFGAILVAITQVAFAVAYLGRRRRREPRRRLAAGWAAGAGLLACQLIPLGILAAAQMHSTGSAGGYAGGGDAGSGAISFYTVVANVSWSLWGFHPENVTQLMSAVWPLFMLLSLLLLGRGLSARTGLLVAVWLGPVVVLILIGLVHPEVFEVRYFMAGIPIGFVLVARLVTSWTHSSFGRVALGAAVLATLVVGLADQQLDSANPRLYDFRGALAAIRHDRRPGDVLLYEPAEMRYLLGYYAPGVPARPLDGPLPSRAVARRVIVLGTFLDQPRYRHLVDRQLGALDYARARGPMRRFSNVDVWSFR